MRVDPAGKSAVTHAKLIRKIEAGHFLALRLETGRTHQIRVHLSALNMPVLGDELYAPREWRTGAMQLHAAFLGFFHPVSGVRLEIYADPPHDFYGWEVAEQDQVAVW
jgi:23S rRNA pseudouridine1911/1915/1917 synthase